MAEPRGVAVDAEGHLFVADSGSGRLIRFDAAGRAVKTWGGGGELVEPVAVAIDRHGRVLVLDAELALIRVYDRDGNRLATIGEEQGMYYPRGFALDSGDSLLVADTGGNRLLQFEADGRLAGILDRGRHANLDQPTDVAAVGQGRIVVVNTGASSLVWLSADGQEIASVPLSLTTTAQGPRLASAGDGSVFVSDPAGGRISYYGLDGKLKEALKPSGPLRLGMPLGLALDGAGALYVADAEFRHVAKLLNSR